MKNPFKKLSDKVKRRALIALVTVGLGLAGVTVNEALIVSGVDIGFQIFEELTDDSE